ncbi:proline dehydrogenase family protein [soil metagenome]
MTDATGALPADLPEAAAALAAQILRESAAAQSPAERRRAAPIARLIDDPAAIAATISLTDRVIRPPSPRRAASVLRHLVRRNGPPTNLRAHEGFALRLAAFASRLAPALVMPAIRHRFRSESAAVILPAEDAPLRRYLESRRRAGFSINLNRLGEAVLGEAEAARRLRHNLALLARPDCTYISVKLSSIFSQIRLVAYEHTLAQACDRLRQLYRAALAATPPKFVNLDMEEYRDVALTCHAFRNTLADPEFRSLEAGIVLQAYLPDAFALQQSLTHWARERVASGGAPIKLRIVKGANLAMERVDASIHGWPVAPFTEKADTDANFKRMVAFGCRPSNAAAVRLGIASHNLFDIAYAFLVREQFGAVGQVGFEMLEGMANHQARTVRDRAGGLLFYSPIVSRRDFPAALAYLVRRLDENTAPENFLHDLFGMRPGDSRWEHQMDRFLASCARIPTLPDAPNRTQDRASESPAPAPEPTFANAPDTDWALPPNRAWLDRALRTYTRSGPPPAPAATPADIDQALATAATAIGSWASRPLAERHALLESAAATLARRRGHLIATMVNDAAKAVAEADSEVSEAIDFARYYARSLDDDPSLLDGTAPRPLGVVVVTPPWNFPLAIPCSGVLAALVSGNTVILKPAPETVLTAWRLAEALWSAGIPRDALQFLPCPDNELGQALVIDDRTAAVILTGAYTTARMFLTWKPGMRLLAETSGKNALVITAAADPDLAIHDLVHSAFGHSGQKCSAASLAIIEADLYDSPAFRSQLRDAAASLPVGPATDLAAVVTPLVQAPAGDLLRGLTQLDPGEDWLLEPRAIPGTENLWSPGIRLGVRPGSWFHRTECFGPVLGLIRAADLDEAISIQNATDFGLTGGIHSLDPDEVESWLGRVEVGNAYINRAITGAIVRRQPFGGWKHSSVGPGAKAGGPNYVPALTRWTESALPELLSPLPPDLQSLVDALAVGLPEHASRLRAAAASYQHAWDTHFSLAHDPSQIRGETNHFRYVPLPSVFVDPDIQPIDRALIRLATHVTGTQLVSDAAQATRSRIPVPALANGRLELLHYLREQTVSRTTHRYGNLTPPEMATV